MLTALCCAVSEAGSPAIVEPTAAERAAAEPGPLLPMPEGGGSADSASGYTVEGKYGRLHLGGYVAVNVEVLDRSPDRLVLDDLSLIATWEPRPDLRLFGEYELEDVVALDDAGLDAGSDVDSLERLYVEYQPVEALRLRAGQMLTPVGIWNRIHAAPLVWTVSRPLATERFFDTALTGIEVTTPLHVRTLDFLVTAFGQATDSIDRSSDEQRADGAGGTRVQVGREERWELGASWMRFHDSRQQRWETTAGADALFSNERIELTTELAVNDPRDGETTWGAYVQGVVHLGRWHPVLRYEHVELEDASGELLVGGLAFKPGPRSIVKLEGVVAPTRLDTGGDGVLASYAVLF